MFQELKIPTQLPMDEEPLRVYGYTVVYVSKTLPSSYKQRTLNRKKNLNKAAKLNPKLNRNPTNTREIKLNFRATHSHWFTISGLA